MAELLIRAKTHWKDEWNNAKVKSLTPLELEIYNARTQLGDIVIVKPDDWVWGGEECLPNFVIVKLPGVSVEEVNNYMESLMDNTDPNNPKMLKHRKHRVPPNYIQNLVNQNQSVVTISQEQINNFRNTIIEKLN